uniref:AlNc14C51G3999 protein n=1 Tax=Albugo laibachii Nc14 TaxID=890382 RepID=F0WBF2_9STRA|nr:AlNc14C51G3999 [Albugo laibachii Nc14]|eukprot:CCA18476.1 AlNc14C51G3999 [Albugo laibachii Nc14]
MQHSVLSVLQIVYHVSSGASIRCRLRICPLLVAIQVGAGALVPHLLCLSDRESCNFFCWSQSTQFELFEQQAENETHISEDVSFDLTSMIQPLLTDGSHGMRLSISLADANRLHYS